MDGAGDARRRQAPRPPGSATRSCTHTYWARAADPAAARGRTPAGCARPAWNAAQPAALLRRGAAPARASAGPGALAARPSAGAWGIAVLVRPEIRIEASRFVPMRTAAGRQAAARGASVVDLTVDGRPISVAGTHMSHLHFGSHRNWAELRRRPADEARPDAVLAGDMNTWGPLVRRSCPGGAAPSIGTTWPAWRPHSQIDHILVRGALRAAAGAVLPNAGSDHRPVRAEHGGGLNVLGPPRRSAKAVTASSTVS